MGDKPLSRDVLHYTLPLGNGRRAEFLLPPDLTRDEAERLARLVAAVVTPEETADGRHRLPAAGPGRRLPHADG